MDRLKDTLQGAAMGASFGLAFFGAEEILHWALHQPHLRWTQILQLVPLYMSLGGLLGGGLGAAGVKGLAGALWVWASYTAVILAGHAIAALGWTGAPFAFFSMLAVVVLVLFLTRERGDEYRWGAMVGGWVVTLFAVVLNATRLGDFLSPISLGVNLAVLFIGVTIAVSVAKALANRRPRAGVWAFLMGLVLWAVRGFLPNPLAADLPRPAKKAKEGVAVVVVLVDGLRSDQLGFLNDAESSTPNLDALASRSIVYPETQAAAPWGVPSLASALTGLAPWDHQARDSLGTDKRTLAEYLSEEADYTTGMVVSNPEYRPGLGLDQGFDWYHRETGLGHEPVLMPAIDLLLDILPERDWPRAERVTDSVLQFIRSRKGTRWIAVAQYSDLRTQDPRAYSEALASIDREIGRLKAAVAPTVWVVVMGTHGNPLGHAGGLDGPWQENLRVPLIVYRPFNLRPATVIRAVSTTDLTPTLLWVTESGVTPRIRLEGRPLEEAVGQPSPSDRRPVVSGSAGWRAVRLDESKLVEQGGDHLYNVVMDPTEDTDLAERLPRLALELGAALPDREPPPPEPEPEPEPELSEEADPSGGTPGEEPPVPE